MRSAAHRPRHTRRWSPRNQSGTAGETSVHPLVERSLISARHVAHGSEFDNPFTKESKHVPRGASSPTWTVGRVGLIDNATMSISDGIILDDERRMSGPPIGWRVFSTARSLHPPRWPGPLKGRKMSQKGYCARPGFALRIGRDRAGEMDGGCLTYDTRGSLDGFASVSPHVVVNVEEARVVTGLAPWSAHSSKCISLIEQSQ